MAEFVQITTVARKLFIPDVIPWSKLLIESNLDKLRARYQLDPLTQVPPMSLVIGLAPTPSQHPQLLSTRGQFEGHLIEQLVIQPVLIQVQIEGESEPADRFIKDLEIFFSEIGPEKPYSENWELTRSYQTIAVAKLSFPINALFSDAFSNFLDGVVKPRLTLPDTSIDIRLNALRWVVSYRSAQSEFVYNPKILVIEPRQGSRISDSLYFTQSPTDSKTHKELVESLEKAVTSGASPAS